MLSLDTMNIGETAIIEEINSVGSIRRRFLDIGIIPGSKIKCVLKSPTNNPVAYLIKGAVIAIRNEDASAIMVKDVEYEG